jgi:hypothetical protein
MYVQFLRKDKDKPPLSKPETPSNPLHLPIIRNDLTIFHLTHQLQPIRPTKSHPVPHDMSVILPLTDLAQHKLLLRLHPDRHRNAAAHDGFHGLPGEHDGLVQHHDLSPKEILLFFAPPPLMKISAISMSHGA